MKAKILFLAVLLTVTGLPAQVPPPARTNTLSHEELLRRATNQPPAAATTAAPAPATPAAIPDWSVTNTPRPAEASANVTPATVTNMAPPTARVAAALTNNKPATVRPMRPAALPPPGFPAASTPPTATPATTPAPAVVATAPPADATAMTLRPAATASTITEPNKIFPAGSFDLPAASLEQILQIYSELVGRNMLRPTSLNMKTDIVLKQTTPLTKLEVVQMFEASMYLNQISVINVGEKFVTVMPTAEAFKIPGIINTNDASGLADMGTIITKVIQVKYVKPSEMVTILTPFASGSAPNPIMPLDTSGMLVLRDNVANVKRMLEMIERVDSVAESEIKCEVIPIKYAKAEEIASALSSVGGGTAGTLGSRSSSSGSSGSRSTSSGLNRTGAQPYGQPGATGLPGATPTPSSQQTFGDRVRNLITKAAGAGDFSILGETKIIADIRSNSLLVFASKQDMDMIKDIISKLDVVLAQVLIETIIMDVSLDNTLAYGVSAAQTPKNITGSFSGTGGLNLSRFTDVAGGNTTSTATNAYSDLIGKGLRYFGKLDDEVYIQLEAAATDGRATIVQKPRILTSHAKEGSIFLGESRPIVSSTYYGGSYGGGPSSSYQQQQAGISLIVTPYVNTEGLVVMEINQEISDFKGTTEIAGVGAVPNIIQRNLKGEVAVNNGESVILGGIIVDRKEDSRSGVPILKDIPLLGVLFSSRGQTKGRSELVVLMRPTVLKTPEMVAKQTILEKQKMPGITDADIEMQKREEKDIARAKALEKNRATEKSKAANKNKKSKSAADSDFKEPAAFTPEDEHVLFGPPPKQ